jgi:uracil-DNA glycosylase family 4
VQSQEKVVKLRLPPKPATDKGSTDGGKPGPSKALAAATPRGSLSVTVTKPVLRLPQVRPKSSYDPRAAGADCDNCPCRDSQVVPPALVKDPKALIVAEFPGWEELRQGQPLVGPNGKKINRVIDRHSLKRETFSATYTALCLPKRDDDRAKACKCCEPRLQREIQALPAGVPVITLGAAAFKSVLHKKLPIGQVRGFVWEKDGREVYPTLDPYFLRDAVQGPLWQRDWRRIAKRVHDGKLDTLKPRIVKYPKTVAELRLALAPLQNDAWLACDVETSKEPPTVCQLECIGISNLNYTVVIAWSNPKFGPILTKFFKGKRLVFHNGFAFDSIVMPRFGIYIDVKSIEDTLIAHHGYASHFRQGMDHLCSVYLDAIPWKVMLGLRGTDEKGRPKNLGEKDLLKYNAYDNIYEAHLWEAMRADVANNQSLYEHDKRLAEICRHMTIKGTWVDEERRQELSNQIKAKIDRLYAEMKELAGRDFSPTKPADIREILFDQFHAPVLERTEKQGLPSTGKHTLMEFALKKDTPYGKFAKALTTHRMCKKIAATHVDKLPIEADGRVHPGWKSFATPTGRVGCIAKGSLVEVVRDVSRYPKGIPIEDVKIGDLVYSYTKYGKLALRRVLNVMDSGRKPVVRIEWRGTGHKYEGHLDLTDDHRVKLTSGKWISAGKLKPGDHLVALSRDVDKRYGYARLWPTGYPAISREHRFIFKEMNGYITEHVHHRDHNGLNNVPNNLAGMTASEHSRHHGANISSARRAKLSASSKRLYAEGRTLKPMKLDEHPMCLGLTREEVHAALSANQWSVLAASKSLGHDFDSFKRHVVLNGFDIKTLKKLNRAVRRGDVIGTYDPSRVIIDAASISKLEMQSLLDQHVWSISGIAKSLGLKYYELRDRFVELGFDVNTAKTLSRSLKPRHPRTKHLANNHMVLSVKHIGFADTFDIEVEGTHNFIANEICVHNCKGPNMCNMKRADNRFKGEPEFRIREIFSAAPGNVLVAFDLSQVEPRLAAHISNCKEFIEAVETGDIHTAIARILFGDLPELVDSETAKTKGKSLRQVGKSCGLAVSYGAGAETLWETLKNDGNDISFSRVQVMLNLLRKKFRSYFAFVERNLDECRRTGYIIAGWMSGRKRWLGHAPEPQKVSNTPIQGGAADAINYRWIEMYDLFEKKYGDKAMFIGQVYDSVIVECPESLGESVMADMKEIMGRPYMIGGHEMYLPIDLKMGQRLSDI